MIKIVHLITDFSVGGAQTVLYNLLSHLDRKGFKSWVFSLGNFGPIGDKIRELGIPSRALEMKPFWQIPWKLVKFITLLRQIQPDLIHTWMYHSDLVGGLCAGFLTSTQVIWGIHHSDFNPSGAKTTTLRIGRINGYLSSWLPRKIVYCSDEVSAVHTNAGYRADKSLVIHNGIDLTDFSPSESARASVRNELGVPKDKILIGLLARFHPLKGHQVFFKAAGLVHQLRPDVNFILCGDGIDYKNTQLMRYIHETGVRSVTHLLGRRSDMNCITAALDIATCSSYCESFSLTLGEAIACCIPCVTTNIPGPVSLLGNVGWIVPVDDYRALASAWIEILNLSPAERTIRGEAGRKRIVNHFSMDETVRKYQDLYEELICMGRSLNLSTRANES